jgi:hypothetical protein
MMKRWGLEADHLRLVGLEERASGSGDPAVQNEYAVNLRRLMLRCLATGRKKPAEKQEAVRLTADLQRSRERLVTA